MAVTSAENSRRKVAHFLLLPELAASPPNEAIVSAWLELGYDVDLVVPDHDGGAQALYGPRVAFKSFPGGWGYRGMLQSLKDFSWRHYSAFSATAEDPFPIVSALARLHRRPFVALVDEIKNGTYAGDRSPRWKALCQRAIRMSDVCIVNDESRVALVREYSGRPDDRAVQVYPGCFRTPPAPGDVRAIRRAWGADDGNFVIGVSGGVNLTSGFDWVVDAADRVDGAFVLVQPVNLDPFTDYLMRRTMSEGRGFVETRRLSWNEAWTSAAACDVGVSIYRNTAPQFQNMGISSNRLCMFLAMGVPVIASRQPSFEFIERYGCGVLVSGADEFAAALKHIRHNAPAMREAALRTSREYIAADRRYQELVSSIRNVVGA